MFNMFSSNDLFGNSKNGVAPDFAFPEKVQKTAETDLKAALKANDGKAVVNAVIRLGLAKSQVNTDSLPSVLAQIAELTARENDPVTRGLLNSLSATIYTQIYSDNRWQYNSREAIADAGDDFTRWSRSQFLDKVVALVEASMTDADVLAGQPITDFSGVVNIAPSDVVFYPTLLDFIAYSGIENLECFDEMEAKVLSSQLIVNPTDPTLYPGKSSRPIAEILELYARLLTAHSDNIPSRYINEKGIRRYILNHTFSDSLDSYRAEMLRLYYLYKENPYSGLFLLEATDWLDSQTVTPEIFNLLCQYEAEFPTSKFAEDVANRRDNLMCPSVSCEIPSVVALYSPFEVKLESVNGKNVKIELYDVSQSVKYDQSSYGNKLIDKPIESKTLHFEQSVPFVAEQTVELTCQAYGVYAVKLTVDGVEKKPPYSIIRCTNLSVQTANINTERLAWVVDNESGEPMKGVDVRFVPWSRGSVTEQIITSTTDSEGEVNLKAINGSGYVRAYSGEDKYGDREFLSNDTWDYRTQSLEIKLFTSLGLYRPGDEVEFALVAYNSDYKSREIASGQRIGVELRNANYESIDTLVVVTDSWGRAEGKFTLPTSGLTGRYSLRAGYYDLSTKIIKSITNKSFEVSDYKLPTFELITEKIVRPASVGEGAMIQGRALTYSGFPVANASVKLKMKNRRGCWWWTTETDVFYTAETLTDEQGGFTLDIPASEISGSPIPNGIFVSTIDVTSEAGETHQMTAMFNLGKPLEIAVTIPAKINLSDKFAAKVEASDINGEKQSLELNYTISKADNVVASGRVSTGSIVGILENLPSGRYVVRFAPVDESKADAPAPAEVILYRPTDSVCPVDAALWVAQDHFIADESGNVNVIVGSNCDDAHVRVILTTYPGNIVEKRWITLKKGMQKLTFTIPEGELNAKLNLACVKNCSSYSADVSLFALASLKSIKVEIESFRDKVVPGRNETITLRVKPTEGATAESAIFMDMSSKAIDLLASNPISLPRMGFPGWNMSFNGWDFTKDESSVSGEYKYNKEYQIEQPGFNFYDLSFMNGGRRYDLVGSVKMMSRSNGAYHSLAECSYMEDFDDAEFECESALACADSAETAGAESEGLKTADDNSNYRPSEIPLAFFRPMLTTAVDGSLEISYEVPDANTTWILRAMAYNKELLTSSTDVEIVASKPVMVEQNAPRFLRTADEVTLLSTVMNNTGDTLSIPVRSELLSASTGKVLASNEQTLTLQPMRSATVQLDVVAPVGETGLIYRVKATAGDFIDGEQSLLPILPSEQDVVESEIFYIPSEQASFTLNLPAMADGDRAYLNFTENPAWQVVSALPGLRENRINSSVEASASLFSAAIADGLMRDYPEIAKVLRRWAENPSDSALVSALQKNSELKAMLLNATPWVSEAMSDTQRMQRLVLLFDKRQTKKVINEAIDQLARLKVGGGWSWSEKFPDVSLWCTEVILEELGDLNRLGWLPTDSRLQRMIKEAVEYLDREFVKLYKDYPKSDYWYYVVIRDMFPDIKCSTAASRVIEAQIQKALAQWKGSSVALKGIYALILNNHGYSSTARLILESLREYATSTPEKGMWWQQLDRNFNIWSFDRVATTSIILDAFHAVEPNCADVEKIRQWLILSKTNNDWGSAIATTQTIASILVSGKPLTVNSRGTAIHIGDELLQPQRVEYATGQFTEQITSMLREPQVMTIDRQADYPSVGGIVMMRRLPMDSIGAVSCEEIAVEKSLSVFDGSQWQPATEFKLGDRVRVELTLKVEDDLSYVVISDQRAAGLEPVEQLPTPIASEGLWFYRENRDSQTNIFINFLPRGTYRLAYELFASQAGSFSGGVAQAQSQYNPIVAAHSAGANIRIN